jgi:hypothetical protein
MMSQEHNPLGGKNPNSLYVPLSETEQEFVSRLIEAQDLQVRVHGWGIVPNPSVQLGDLQVVIPLTLAFDRPEVPIPVHHFDLELLTGSGVSLYRETQSCEYGGQPIMVGSGTVIQMVWHIGVKAMDPKLVKTLMPGTVGLTSRAFDKDTGDLTLTGNMHLNGTQKKLITLVRTGEDRVRADRDAKVHSR